MTIQFRWHGTSIVSLSANQWQPNDGTGSPLRIEGGSGITADLAVTLGAVTLSSGVSNAIKADLSQTLGAVSLSATASSAIAANLAQSLGAVSLSAAAKNAIAASLAQSLGAVTVASIAKNAIAGALSQSLGSVTLSADATISGGGAGIAADLSQTLGAISLTATATVSQPPSMGQIAQAVTGGQPSRRRRRDPLSIAYTDSAPVVRKPRVAALNLTLGDVSLLAEMSMAEAPAARMRRRAIAALLLS